MKEPILADTSVWIDFFKGEENQWVLKLTDYIENDYPVFLCPTVIQEILQGITSDSQYKKIKKYLLCFNVLNDDALESALSAANIYRSIRKKGFTIKKSKDCLIAHYAFKYSLDILHKDRDFDIIINNL